MVQSIKHLIEQLEMMPHEEGGWFSPIPEVAATTDPATGRAASGAIYYALLPGETSDFHVIDCDEYWCHHAGDTLEIWMIDPRGNLSVQLLGAGGGVDGKGGDARGKGSLGAGFGAGGKGSLGAKPLVWVPAGTAFAARHLPGNEAGTVISCITVPKFDYAGWKLYSKEQACELCPDAAAFWE